MTESLFSTWNLLLIYIIGAEIIHLFQIRYTPDLLSLDLKPEQFQEKYSLRDIYPFLLIEIFYLLALFFLLFSPQLIHVIYSLFFLSTGILKLLFLKRLEERNRFVLIDAWITIILTLLVLYFSNIG